MGLKSRAKAKRIFRGFAYLLVMVNTPSQAWGGSSNKYSWHRFQ